MSGVMRFPLPYGSGGSGSGFSAQRCPYNAVYSVFVSLVLYQRLVHFHDLIGFFLLPFSSIYTDSNIVVRSQKSVGLVGGSSTYDLVEAFQAPVATVRTYQYSPDGRIFALSVPSGCV